MSLEELIDALNQELAWAQERLERVEHQNQALILQNQDLNRIIEGLKECQAN